MIMHVVTFACDQYTENVEVQLTRDLMILLGEWDLALWDPKKVFSESILQQLGIRRAGGSNIALCISYKTGDEWPETPTDVPVVERDLKPNDRGGMLDSREHVGFYLTPQGKGVTNRAEFYLNRAHPRGKGVANPLVTLLWG